MTTSVTIIGAGPGGLALARVLGDSTPASLIDLLTGREPAL
jgi:flavin-dependent dehydrogenase